jgi:hypothetical protein
MIVILGDSNYRNMLDEHSESLSASISEEIKFFMCTSNESTRIQLEGRTDNPKIILVGCPLNEIVHKYNDNKKKGRAETIKDILEEQNKMIRSAASACPQTLFVLVPPFLRLEPVWIKERLSLAIFHVRDFVGEDSPWNITVANPVKLVEEDVSGDKIHLNKNGKEKLMKSLLADILVCKENLGEGPALDWSSQLSSSQVPTPATFRKRPRPVEDIEMEDEDEEVGGKKARLDTVLDRINVLVKEIKSEREASKAAVQELNAKVDTNIKAVEENKIAIAKLQDQSKASASYDAEVREDLDGLENENLKNTVIVRKLKGEAPKEKKELRAFIQNKGRELVKEILSQEAAADIKYCAPLYSFVDPTKKDNKAGLVPPFKIGFAAKDMAVKFRDAAVKKAKEVDSLYKDTYFSFYQSFGTKVRCLIMWGICDTIKSKDRECWVNQNLAKPTLQVKENGRIVKTLSFIKAVAEYKDKIPNKTIEEATKIAKNTIPEILEKSSWC